MEKQIWLWRRDIPIIQRDDLFRFAIDSVLVSDFAQIGRNTAHILDLGCGNGAIPLFLARKCEAAVTGLDILPEACDLARRNMELNRLAERVRIICDDMKNWRVHLAPRSMDHVITNPPFFRSDGPENLVTPRKMLATARHEGSVRLEDILGIAAAVLKEHGRFTMVHRASRMTEILDAMRAVRIEPKRLRFCHARKDRDARILLLDGVLFGKPGLTILPPLFLHGDGRGYSDEVKAMFMN